MYGKLKFMVSFEFQRCAALRLRLAHVHLLSLVITFAAEQRQVNIERMNERVAIACQRENVLRSLSIIVWQYLRTHACVFRCF